MKSEREIIFETVTDNLSILKSAPEELLAMDTFTLY